MTIMSGRAMPWIIERVLTPLESHIENKQLLNNLFLSGEFGGTYGWYENGIRKLFLHHEYALPDNVKNELATITQKYTPYVFIDTEKQTHFTAERSYDCSPEVFAQHKSEIAEDLQRVIKDYHLEKNISLHEDRLAINIRDIRENKKNATQAFLNWLQKHQQPVNHYFAFGDSPSDIEIGQALSQEKLPFTFIFVGEKDLLTKQQTTFPITYTQNLFAEGTVEFLEKNLS